MKSAFDAIKSVFALVKEVRSVTKETPEQAKALDDAIKHAEVTAAVAEAENSQGPRL